MDLRHDRRAIALILTLVLPSQGLNALGMRRVGSHYVVSILFIRQSSQNVSEVLEVTGTFRRRGGTYAVGWIARPSAVYRE